MTFINTSNIEFNFFFFTSLQFSFLYIRRSRKLNDLGESLERALIKTLVVWLYREVLGLSSYCLGLALKKLRLCLVTIFVFYFQKLVFENIKKKQFSCIFEIKNMFGQLKLKKMVFLRKKKENTKICYYQNLNFNVNSLNEIDSLN